MQREDAKQALEQHDGPWDFIVIGGGATGLGCAIEAASRGYDTLLLEMHDFAKATSSRSTRRVSPLATRYCLPPVRMTAYIVLSPACWRLADRFPRPADKGAEG